MHNLFLVNTIDTYSVISLFQDCYDHLLTLQENTEKQFW